MKKGKQNSSIKFSNGNKNIIRILLLTAFILLIPLVAMQFTNDIVWTLFDFVVVGGLLLGAGFTYELVSRKMGDNTYYKAAVGIAVLGALLLIWVNGAVGIIGSEDNPANFMYAGVLFLGIIGAIIARLKPIGMMRTLFAMAALQMMVPVIALFISRPEITLEPPGVAGVFVINALFAMMFVTSALLFRRASIKRQN